MTIFPQNLDYYFTPQTLKEHVYEKIRREFIKSEYEKWGFYKSYLQTLNLPREISNEAWNWRENYLVLKKAWDENEELRKVQEFHEAQEKERQKAAREAAEEDFKRFFINNMDLSTPEKQSYWTRNFPEVFQERNNFLRRDFFYSGR